MAGKGFASLSKEKRRIIAKMGGKASAEKYAKTGRGHAWSPAEAKVHGDKAAATRKRNRLVQAARTLLGAGFSPMQLATANLSESEYLALAKAPTADSTKHRILGT